MVEVLVELIGKRQSSLGELLKKDMAEKAQGGGFCCRGKRWAAFMVWVKKWHRVWIWPPSECGVVARRRCVVEHREPATCGDARHSSVLPPCLTKLNEFGSVLDRCASQRF